MGPDTGGPSLVKLSLLLPRQLATSGPIWPTMIAVKRGFHVALTAVLFPSRVIKFGHSSIIAILDFTFSVLFWAYGTTLRCHRHAKRTSNV